MYRVLVAALVAALVLLMCPAPGGAQPALMPALDQYAQVDEDVAMLVACGIVVGLRGYNTIGHEDAAWFKLIAVYRSPGERPFLVFLWADEEDQDSELTVYADYDLDGAVDEQRIVPLEEQNQGVTCAAHAKMTAPALANP